MLIWLCDNCGHKVEVQPIVGNEFEYDEHGFGSLSRKVDGKQDLCETCMDKGMHAARKVDQDRAASKWDALKSALGVRR